MIAPVMSSSSFILLSASPRLRVILFNSVPDEPVLAGVFEVLLGIDFNVAAGGIDVGEALAAFEHLLEEKD